MDNSNLFVTFIASHIDADRRKATEGRMRSANTYCRGRAFVVAIEPKGRHS